MKSMMLTGIRQMEMKDIPEPVLTNSNDVKIKMSVVGVCGSDIHYYTLLRLDTKVQEWLLKSDLP
jgi:threonine dehydrogenase-like Zn-dependent dehydrogenase